MTTYIRHNAWNQGGTFNNQAVYWYARGVGKMMTRPLNDTASWWFFAAIHGQYITGTTTLTPTESPIPTGFPNWGKIQGPPSVPTSPLPTDKVQKLFWDQCQHQSWFFPPWHRGYLMALEAQLRKDIVALGGPASWALPYWNYFGGPNGEQYVIPPAFAQEEYTVEGEGTQPNPLFVAMRYGPDADGNVYVPTDAWQAANPGSTPTYGDVEQKCLQNDVYTGRSANTPSPGFGGPRTKFSHGGSSSGNLEQNPHNITHSYIGGAKSNTDYGLMSDPGTAALDPIFYMHHGNIDRMWAVWNAMGNANPTLQAWLNGPSRRFAMPLPDGSTWRFTPMQMTNLKALNYTYDDLAPPKDATAPVISRLFRLGASEAADTTRTGFGLTRLARKSELLGAGSVEHTLATRQPLSAPVRLDPGPRKRLVRSHKRVTAAELPDRVYIRLENVKGTHDPGVLGVYVDLPTDPTAEERRASWVGAVGLFGVRMASNPNGEHGGAGLSFTLDATDAFDRLFHGGDPDLDDVTVSVIPTRDLPENTSVTVGRISLYRERL